jgi:hypothetical protein
VRPTPAGHAAFRNLHGVPACTAGMHLCVVHGGLHPNDRVRERERNHRLKQRRDNTYSPARSLSGQKGKKTVATDLITELLETTPVVVAPRVEPVAAEAGSRQPPRLSAHSLPAVSTSRDALRDPRGWYQRALTADAVTTGVNVLQLAVENLSPDEREQAQAFTRHTLQRSGGRVRPFALPADSYTWAWPTWSALIKADQRVVAHAGIIYRVIQIGDLRVPVGGIAGVMTLPGWRQRGYARAALAKATAFVGIQLWAPFAVVICPKEDFGFYKRGGWRTTDAPIWCDQLGGRVKLEDEAALFVPCQGDADWPSGPIDLCGAPW